MIFKPGWTPDVFDNRDKKYKTPLLKRLRPVPNMVDLRPNCPPIRNQGNLGSCTGFGAAFVYELALQIKGWIDPSELFVYYNARYIEHTTDEDAGAQIRDAIKGVVKYGLCSEKLWPYDEGKFAEEPPSACYREAKQHRALSYESIKPSVRDMQQVLADGWGITLGLYLYSSFFSDSTARTGVIKTPNTSAENFEGGHCCGICGYDNDREVFILRNSWNTTWGDAGYGYLPFSYAVDESIACDRWTIRKVNM